MLRLLRGRGDEHAWVRENISAYHDRALSAGEASRIELHLAACSAGCVAELETLRQAAAAVRALPELRAPRSFALTPNDVRRARPVPVPPVRSQPSGFWGKQRALEFGAMAAAVLFVAVVVGDAVTRPTAEPEAAPVAMAAADSGTRNSTDLNPEATGGEFTTEAAPEATASPMGDVSPTSKAPATTESNPPEGTPGTSEVPLTTFAPATADGGNDLANSGNAAAQAPDDERTWLVVLEVTAGSALVLLLLLAMQRRFGNKSHFTGV